MVKSPKSRLSFAHESADLRAQNDLYRQTEPVTSLSTRRAVIGKLDAKRSKQNDAAKPWWSKNDHFQS